MKSFSPPRNLFQSVYNHFTSLNKTGEETEFQKEAARFLLRREMFMNLVRKEDPDLFARCFIEIMELENDQLFERLEKK